MVWHLLLGSTRTGAINGRLAELLCAPAAQRRRQQCPVLLMIKSGHSQVCKGYMYMAAVLRLATQALAGRCLVQAPRRCRHLVLWMGTVTDSVSDGQRFTVPGA
jgi:hypothetical protein